MTLGPAPATSAQIFDQFLEYEELGVIEYVLPTDPLGEQWVLGQQGRIVKLIGNDQARAWLAGASAAAVSLAKRAGLKL